jgi:hypothetical protein
MRHLITAGLYMAAIVHVMVLRAWPHFLAWLVGSEPAYLPPASEATAPVDYASLLEGLTVKDLRATCVTLGLPSKTYRAARKSDLIALLADLHVNPIL